MDCEVLVQPATALRGEKMLNALIEAAPEAGVRCNVVKMPTGKAQFLMSYGLGHPVRRPWTLQHVKRGGRLIGWDLGYWDRDVSGRAHMRLTIDDDHPHRWIEPMPPERWDAAGIALREDANPDGPILLCGMGKKQRDLRGFRTHGWELAALQRIHKAHPGREVIYRPKRPEMGLPGCRTSKGPIEEALRGASLVVCSHSNVAVDACIGGVPVNCEDGAAYALYRDNPAPTPAQRLEFLRSLAWWQWHPAEAMEAWKFIRQRLSA